MCSRVLIVCLYCLWVVVCLHHKRTHTNTNHNNSNIVNTVSPPHSQIQTNREHTTKTCVLFCVVLFCVLLVDMRLLFVFCLLFQCFSRVFFCGVSLFHHHPRQPTHINTKNTKHVKQTNTQTNNTKNKTMAYNKSKFSFVLLLIVFWLIIFVGVAVVVVVSVCLILWCFLIIPNNPHTRTPKKKHKQNKQQQSKQTNKNTNKPRTHNKHMSCVFRFVLCVSG